jgi:L-threonylcarbamoyladenylate synthase
VLPADDASAISRAVSALNAGELVVLPTDTVYGLAASYRRPAAVGRIYEVKRRPPDRPIALLVDQVKQVELVAECVPPAAITLMQRFWPGGLTLVLPKKANVPDVVTANGPTVAVRMPNHPTPREIARRLGEALPTTSANRSGQPSPRDAEEARAQLGSDVDLILNGGPAALGVDSTVIDLSATPPIVLRVGAVSVDAIEAAIGQRVKVSSL